MLSVAQEKRLNRLFLSGDIGGGAWSTVASLLRLGMIEERNRRLVVTKKGIDYCRGRGTDMPL